jgi:hypothetical protein
LIYNNITFGQARIMTGNVGVEYWRRIAGRKVTIANNKFGQDVRIMTGDQGGDAAKSFNDNFWKQLYWVHWRVRPPSDDMKIFHHEMLVYGLWQACATFAACCSTVQNSFIRQVPIGVAMLDIFALHGSYRANGGLVV